MQNRKTLPNPELDVEQHLRVLAAAAAAAGYDTSTRLKVGQIVRQPLFREGKRIKPNQVNKTLESFVSLGLVEYNEADNTFNISEAAVNWAKAKQNGDSDAATSAMQNALAQGWLGKAVAQAPASDPNTVRQTIIKVAGFEGIKEDRDVTKSAQILSELVARFDLSDAVGTYEPPAPEVQEPLVPEAQEPPAPEVQEPLVPEAQEPPAPEGQVPPVPEVQEGQPTSPANPGPIPTHTIGVPTTPTSGPQFYTPAVPFLPADAASPSVTNVTVSTEGDIVRVQIHIALQLPANDAKRRMELTLQALLNQVVAQLPGESD